MALEQAIGPQNRDLDRRKRDRNRHLIADVAAGVILWLTAWSIAHYFDFYERIEAFHRRFETFGLDELLYVSPLALIGFLYLRSRALQREVEFAERAEKMARDNEERQSTLAEISAEWTWEMDADFRFSYLSPQFDTVTGVAREKLLQVNGTQLPPSNHQNHPVDLASRLKAWKKFHDFTFAVLDEQSRVRHLRISGRPVLGPNGRCLGYLGVGNDVTAKFELETQIAAAHARLSDALESSPSAIMLFDASKRLMHCNSRVFEFFPEVASAIVTNAKWGAIVHAFLDAEFIDTGGLDKDTWARQRLEEFRRSGQTEIFRTKSGRWFKTIERAMSEGSTIRIWFDITEVKEQEQKIIEQSALLRATLDNIEQGLLVVDGENCALLWNHRFADLLGLPRDLISAGAPINKALSSLPKWGEENREKIASCLLSSGNGGAQVASASIEIANAEGESVDIRYRILPGGRKVVSLTDMTQRRQTEHQLRHSQKMEAIGQLTAGVAHEFNNLLTVISGFSRMAIKKAEDAEQVRDCLSEVTTAADHAAALTRQMLAFGRKQSLKTEIVRASDFIGSQYKMLKPLLGETVQLRVESDVADDTLISIDPGQLTQVIVNLAINARDAMPNGGDLTISMHVVKLNQIKADRLGARSDRRYVALLITDNGHGMDGATTKRIFEPFFTTKEFGQGTGLGLSVVYGIVQQLEGFIDLVSSPGKGTTFFVYLPLVEGHALTSTTLPEERTSVAAARELTILVAEDEPAVRRFLSAELNAMGYRVLMASNGEEAIQVHQAHQNGIDLLLTDVVMPVMGGVECARVIQAERPGIKVLYMTGYASREVFRRANLEGRIALMNKPFTEIALRRRIEEIFPIDELHLQTNGD